MHKFNENEGSTQDKAFLPYCFPNMQDAGSAGKRTAPENADFRHINFDESGKLCPSKNTTDTDVFEDIKPDIKEIEEQGYAEGFEKGKQDGLRSVNDRLEPVLKGLNESFVELEKAKKELLLRTEQEAVELSLAVAKKIVSHEIKINREVVLNVVKAALKKVVDRKKIKIKLAPPDFQFLNDVKPQISGLEEDFEKVSFEEDKSILTGGCVIETNLGDIDARIENQLQAVEDAFRSEINKLRLGG